MRAVGLFSGVGGLELGMAKGGFESSLLCDVYEPAKRVLAARFPRADLHSDVTTLRDLPEGTGVLTAGFPCQDLSQAGKTAGITGSRSGLVGEVFRLVGRSRPRTVVIENVSFMLSLHAGEPMRRIVEAFEDMGYRWAWRVVDSNAFGLPQRRMRVFFVASLDVDPARVLLVEDAPFRRPGTDFSKYAHGFYWTEGKLGLGWAVNAIPTLKTGSTIGIASPPAILRMDGRVVKPDIEDAERLQGFEAGWTRPAEEVARPVSRWTLVGNAVSVPVAEWVGGRIATGGDGEVDPAKVSPFPVHGKLPKAACFDGRRRWAVAVSTDPVQVKRPLLEDFLRCPGTPLSRRALRGFLGRARQGRVKFAEGFIPRVEAFLEALA